MKARDGYILKAFKNELNLKTKVYKDSKKYNRKSINKKITADSKELR